MRKFMLCAVLLLALGALAWTAVYVWGFYIRPLRGDGSVELAFRTEGADILRPAADGGWETFSLRGVDLSASQPGHYATAYAADEQDYLRWMDQITGMGANAIRVSTIMDDDFYNALYRYNTESSEPLYLFQGIQVSDEANYGDQGVYSDEFLGSLTRDGKDAVDIIHGRKTIVLNELRGSGSYRCDVSPWVVGYQVGYEWGSDTIAYADHSAGNPDSYVGQYFVTADEATPFEALLARVMDEITTYETEKYGVQRLIGFVSSPDCDFLHYEERYARQLQKVCWLDAEHVLPTDALKSGVVAAYRLYDYCNDFSQYLEPAQLRELSAQLSGLDSDGPYGGYLHLLTRYHTMPVVVSFGFSSARGAIRIGQEPLTELEQGRRLAELSREAEEYGCAGVVLSTWQDEWERRSWNTAFSTVLTENYRWHDVQSDSQGYGLMAFEPGEEAACIVDGDAGEWSPADRVLSQDGLTLSMRWDAEGLYLLAQGEGVGETPFYIPIDTTQLTGSTSCADPELYFEREVDFVLCVDGREDTRLLVQERYNPLRANFLYETEGRDPYIVMPAKNTTRFSIVEMALENSVLVDTEIYSAQEMQQMRRLGVYETGRLVYGSRDPDSSRYNSLADFCFGEGCAEFRIPWQLLNVGNPADMQIHGDYYTYYGIEFQSMSQLWLGLYRGEGVCALYPADISGSGDTVQCRERLKQSYYVMQQAWKGETAQ